MARHTRVVTACRDAQGRPCPDDRLCELSIDRRSWRCTADLLSDGRGGVGYLLKDRIGALDDFLDALQRVAAGGSAMDPEVVAQLLRRGRRHAPLATLTAREREVLALMAEGLSNAAIARRLVLALVSVEKHIGSILTKLNLVPGPDVHRRVLAVLTYLDHAAR